MPRKKIKSQVWFHAPTLTLGIVTGDFVEFYWNGVREKSYWAFIQKYWTYVDEL